MLSFLRYAAAVLIIACSPLVNAAELISVGGGSHHFERDLGLNEANYGLGYERDINEEWTWAAGVYKNSIKRASFYLLGNYYPFDLGAGFRAGLTGGLMSGYHQSPIIPMLAPTLEWRGKWVAIQSYVVPTVKPYVDGAIIFQLKFFISH
ncbi:MAG: hypothetical protein QM803_10550 [Rhodocyclaceae bacterium]